LRSFCPSPARPEIFGQIGQGNHYNPQSGHKKNAGVGVKKPRYQHGEKTGEKKPDQEDVKSIHIRHSGSRPQSIPLLTIYLITDT
jgi:hypothetical protein